MGIKELNKTVCKYGDPNIFKVVKAEKMKGKRFAVDISIFICGFAMTSQDAWFNTMTNFLISFIKYKVNVIIIFDGKNVPKEKLVERELRKTTQQNQKARLDKIKFFKEKLMMRCFEGDEIKLVPEPLQEEFQEVFKRSKIDDINPKDAEEVLTFVQEKVDKAEQAAEGVQAHHKTMTRELVKAMGIPYIQADGEAEHLAASMAFQGIVDGVISRDTDTLCYGCPLLVTDIKNGNFHCVELKDMILTLKMDMKQFVDLCICLQCDYNHRMPKNGPAAIYNAIHKYGGIDEWKEACPDKPFHLLKYNRCREIFRPYSKKYFFGERKKCKIRRKKEVNIEVLDRLFDSVNSRYTGEYIKGVMEGKFTASYMGNYDKII